VPPNPQAAQKPPFQAQSSQKAGPQQPAPQPGLAQPPSPVPGAIIPGRGDSVAPGAATQDARKSVASASTLMALGRDRRIMPEDFKIGTLGDDRSEREDESHALQAAGSFLSRLVAGSIEKKLLAPASQDTVADTLAFGLKHGNTPSSFRLGTPKSRDDGEISAAVRLFGSEGTSEGEIYVAPSGPLWLVADLQLSLAQLSVKREKPKEKFFPLEYRWLLEE
jgi:hypothetical protein